MAAAATRALTLPRPAAPTSALWQAAYHGTDDQGNTYATLYAHMNSTPPVSVGQSVSQGDVIGYVGTTGNSTGNHLHLELRVNGARTNPLNYVPH